ncbi:MAG: hypothetical protein WKF79_11310 [Nocardioides sp.]
MPRTWRDEWDETPVVVSTPSQTVFVTLTGTSWVEVRFAPGFYERANAREMAEQLTRALRLLYVERTRQYYAALSAATGQPVRPGTDTGHRRSADYRRRLSELSAEGSSAGGVVRVFGVGLSGFTVSVTPGSLGAMGEDEFAAACREAGLAFLADHLQQVAELRYDVYVRPELEAAGLG